MFCTTAPIDPDDTRKLAQMLRDRMAQQAQPACDNAEPHAAHKTMVADAHGPLVAECHGVCGANLKPIARI